MKPGDHPDFFRLPPPEGRSRESSIHLDAEGNFWHDGALVEHPGMARAFASWIRRHPDDGRFILSNGYDWSYFSVADTPFFVISLRAVVPGEDTGGDGAGAGAFELVLSDGTCEPLSLAGFQLGETGVCFARVKDGTFRARFSRAAQLALGPLLEEDAEGRFFLVIGGDRRELSSPPQ